MKKTFRLSISNFLADFSKRNEVKWIYKCLIMAVFIGTIYSSNIIRMTDTNEGIFKLYQRNKRHATAPYKPIDTDTLYKCVDACLYETSCKSVNLDKSIQPWKCELVNSDRNVRDEYVEAPGVLHYDTGRTGLTTIRNNANTACVVPSGLVCDFTSDDVILISTRDMDICNNHRAALFFYDVDLGFLIHH